MNQGESDIAAIGGPYFADRLAAFGDSTAVVCKDGACLSYRQLASQADAWAARLGKRRALVLIAAENNLPSLIAYLGCLRHRHPVILTDSGSADSIQRVTDHFQPDAVYAQSHGEWVISLEKGPAGRFHPDLAVLLSTSGSTGNTKLVRLSFQNIEFNARSIREYLGIDSRQRAATTLPFFYSYGLSVVNSHLSAGASIFLNGDSLIDGRFWDNFNRFGCTSFAGVPYSFKLLDQAGFETRQLPRLQYVTQAGGRMPPEDVVRFARLGLKKGWRLFVMYGQTEASPRIAYLPPEQAISHPESIGIAIPGGELSVRDANGHECDVKVPGELFYRGPNVMMGYAYARGDLDRGRETDELPTGDIAYRNQSGLYTIVGRKSRFSKIAGQRISFDDLEALLKIKGYDVVCTGTDERIVVATSGPVKIRDVATAAAIIVGLPLSYIAVVTTAEMPRLPSGKYDYQRIMKLAVQANGPEEPTATPVLQAFQSAMPGIEVHATSTLESLGGDSLSEIELGLEIEKRFGFVPDGWTKLSIATLDRMLAGSATSAVPSVRSSSVKTTPANTLRGLACIAITLQHVIGDSPLQGLRLEADNWLLAIVYPVNFIGASLLFFVAGYLTLWPARQTLQELAALLRLRLVRIFVPLIMLTAAYFAARSWVGAEPLKFWQALTYSYLHLWFLKALICILVLMAGLSYFFAGNEKRLVMVVALPALVLFALQDTLLTDIFSISAAFRSFPIFLSGVAARAWNLADIRQSAWPRQAAGVATLVLLILGIEAVAIISFAGPEGPGIAVFDARSFYGLPVAIGLYFLLLAADPRSRFLSFIGMAAFEIYLFHIFFATGGRYFLAAVFPEAPVMLKVVALTLAALMGPILLGRSLASSRVLAFLFLGRLFGMKNLFGDGEHKKGPALPPAQLQEERLR